MLKKKMLSALQYLVLLAIGIALLILAFKDINLNNMLMQIEQANYFWVGLSIIASLLAYISRAARWNMLIYPLGYKPKLKNTLAALLAGYLANLAVPRMGEVTRCGALNQTDNIPFNELIGTVIVERALDLIMLVLSISLVIFLQYNLVAGFINEHVFLPLITKFSIIIDSPLLLTILLIIFLAIITAIYWVFKNKHRFPIFLKINKLLMGVWQGVQHYIHLGNVFFHVIHLFFCNSCHITFKCYGRRFNISNGRTRHDSASTGRRWCLSLICIKRTYTIWRA
jgi:uncharacterized protein (TIRG00374 family)